MMKLFYNPMSRATRARWMLEELEAPYELVQVSFDNGDTEKPEYLKIHPLGLVPVLTDGELKIFESAAICMYLADKFPARKLAPAPSDLAGRGIFYQWMIYSVAELDPHVLEIFFQTEAYEENERVPSVEEEARGKFHERARMLGEHLRGREFMLGGDFSAADVMIGSTLAWAAHMDILQDHPVLASYVARLTARPAFRRSRAP